MRDLIREVNEIVESEVLGQSFKGSLWIGFYDDGSVDTEWETHVLHGAIRPERLAYHSDVAKSAWYAIDTMVSESLDHDEVVREVGLREFEETDFYALANKI